MTLRFALCLNSSRTSHIFSWLSVQSDLPSRKWGTRSTEPFPPVKIETAAVIKHLGGNTDKSNSFTSGRTGFSPSLLPTVSGCSSRSSISLKSTMMKPRHARQSRRSNEGTFQGCTTPATKLWAEKSLKRDLLNVWRSLGLTELTSGARLDGGPTGLGSPGEVGDPEEKTHILRVCWLLCFNSRQQSSEMERSVYRWGCQRVCLR